MTGEYVPNIEVKHGEVLGYGGPGYDWARVVSNNRVLFESKGGLAYVAVEAERARIKWSGPWKSEEEFLAAISDLKEEYPLCVNCNRPIGKHGCYCLDKAWCDHEICRKALEQAKEDYDNQIRAFEEKRKMRDERARSERIALIEETIQCFHWRDGWYFRRLEDGSVRIMYRDHPSSEFLAVDVTIPSPEWASIVCSVSREGETVQRWEEALNFHGRASSVTEGKSSI